MEPWTTGHPHRRCAGCSEVRDALILGQGLAGTVLAWTLLQRGWDLAVVDDGHGSSSSRVAAGLINPVTGRRLVKTSDADRLLPAAEAFYDSLSRQLGTGPLLHPLPMWRLFRSQLEVEAWDRRCADPGYRAYLGERLPAGSLGRGVVDPLGSGLQRRTAYLDVPGLLDPSARAFSSQGRLTRADVQPFDIRPRDGYVECGGLLAARAILCQGHRAMDGPWFGWLPFQPAKGELLTLETDEALPQGALNAGRWLLPLGSGRFRFGATYDWTSRDQEPTPAGRATLLDDLPHVIQLPDARLVAHRAGVRPAMRDNAPVMGRHPRHPELWIFNGFGSKGALQIPGCAAAMADRLEGGQSLPARLDVGRYAHQSP